MKKIFLTIASVFLVSCAASLRMSTDFDRNANFTNIRTFGIYEVTADARTVSELNRNRIQNAIRGAMISRGFVESAQPDVWINAIAVVNSEESVSSTTMASGGIHSPNMWRVGGIHRPYFWGPTVYHTQYHVDVIKEGVLIIDIIDAQSKHLIWQSIGTRRIDRRLRNNKDDRINQYVREMLNEFPPR